MKDISAILLVIIASLVGCADATYYSYADPVEDVDLNVECPYNVIRHQSNGWIITNPIVSLVFWGSWWQTTVGLETSEVIQETWTQVLATDALFNKVAEYGVTTPILNATYGQYNPNLPTVTSITGSNNTIPLTNQGLPFTVWNDDKQHIQTELSNEIVMGVLPLPTSGSTIYLIILPPNYLTLGLVKNGWDGYHGNGSYGNISYEFAIIQYGVPQFINSIISHELYEASTDPNSEGYWDPKTGMEVSDICNWVMTEDSIASYDTAASAAASGTVIGNNVTVQKVWSQQTCQCH
jgi:hypothetical protein